MLMWGEWEVKHLVINTFFFKPITMLEKSNNLFLHLFRIAIKILTPSQMSLVVISLSLFHAWSLHLMQLAKYMCFEVQYTQLNCQRRSSCHQIQCYSPWQSLKNKQKSGFAEIPDITFELSLKSVLCKGFFMIHFTCKSGCQWWVLGTTNRITTKTGRQCMN